MHRADRSGIPVLRHGCDDLTAVSAESAFAMEFTAGRRRLALVS